MEFIPVETSKNPSDDILIVEREDIKCVDEEVPLVFEVGDGKISVMEELATSVESLETISPDSVHEDDVDDQEMEEQSNTLTTGPLSTDFIRKVWSAFLTFHVFVIPAIIAMILSVAVKFASPEINDPYEDIKYGVMVGFLGASVLVGLPIHMLTLADLEDTVNDIMLNAQMEDNASDNNREGSVDSDSDIEAMRRRARRQMMILSARM
ncbi:hypothetical protein AVEN_124930-1 [Araneus ventricosus]|uniref:Uncharacterized protein n=1 Tax=Araneus ventricosus TaxID=182803 RepID=A0A4Y2U279_ARAVE|nr:hypothetical protein AVEN_124930-1 [Araneus ventricosus]